MSNRRKARRPRADAAVRALVKATRCDGCGSASALQKWDRRAQEWVITPLHAAGCPTRTGKASPHQVSENAAAGARQAGFQLAYVPYEDGSGGVVVDAEPDAAALS